MSNWNIFALLYVHYVRWRRRGARIYALMGGPGAGKDTQAKLVAPLLKLPVVSTGDLCRREMELGTATGKMIEGFVKMGRLAPDEVIFQLLRNELSQPRYYRGFILNGFPRTVAQAKLLEALLGEWGNDLQAVFLLEVPLPDLKERLGMRRVCTNKSCNRSYHLKFSPPRMPNTCDDCGSPLYQRIDDTPEAIEKRLADYTELIKPLRHYYQQKGTLRVIESTNAFKPEDVAKVIIAHAATQA